MRPKTALVASAAFIAVYWACFAAWKLLGPPHEVRDARSIVVNVCVRAVLVTAIVWGFLRWNGESIAGLGLRPDGSWRGAGRLAGLTVAMFVVTNVVLNSLFGALFGQSGTPPIAALFSNTGDAPYWIFSAIVGGGFAEELARAFTLTRFEKLFGRAGLIAALIVDCAVFGLGHLYQGRASALSSAFTGLMCALIYLQRRRVVDAMIVHAVFDLVGIGVAYALYAR